MEYIKIEFTLKKEYEGEGYDIYVNIDNDLYEYATHHFDSKPSDDELNLVKGIIKRSINVYLRSVYKIFKPVKEIGEV